MSHPTPNSFDAILDETRDFLPASLPNLVDVF
jgi:hypothetical protein